MLYTSFNLLKKKGACTDGYRKLANYLGVSGIKESELEKLICTK